MIKALMDWGSVAVAVGALTKLLPAAAALWTIVWLSISIWESKTIRGWCKRGKKPQDDKVDVAYLPRYVKDDDSGDRATKE